MINKTTSGNATTRKNYWGYCYRGVEVQKTGGEFCAGGACGAFLNNTPKGMGQKKTLGCTTFTVFTRENKLKSNFFCEPVQTS